LQYLVFRPFTLAQILEIVKMVLNYRGGMTMDQEKLQEKLLTAADSAKNADAVEKLLQQGADVNATDSFGLTPLMRAALFNSNEKVIKVLVKAGADIFAREPQYKSTALQLAANHNSSAKVIEALVEAGSDIHDVNYLGETALVMAVNSGNDTKVISALIRAGSDVNSRDYQDRSALDYARMSKRAYVVKILKQAGAR
jgi:ankyrin repeat protein